VPAAPINLRKSLRDNPSDFFVPTSDIQAEILDKLVINLIRLLGIFLPNNEYDKYSDRNSNNNSTNRSISSTRKNKIFESELQGTPINLDGGFQMVCNTM